MNQKIKYVFKMRQMSLPRAYAFIEITRPWWLIVLTPIFIASALLANNDVLSSSLFIIALISAIFLKLGISTLNDYFDRDVDKIIHPNRAIPSKRIKPQVACIYGMVLITISLSLAFLVNLSFLTIVFLIITISILHFWKTKRIIAIPGIANIFTSFTLALVSILGWVITSNITIIPIILFFIIFFYDMAHDTASATLDIEGDSKGGIKTFATTLGYDFMPKLVFLFFTITFIISILFYSIIQVNRIYFFYIIMSSIACYTSIFYFLKTPSIGNAKKTHLIMSLYPIIVSFGIIFNILV